MLLNDKEAALVHEILDLFKEGYYDMAFDNIPKPGTVTNNELMLQERAAINKVTDYSHLLGRLNQQVHRTA